MMKKMIFIWLFGVAWFATPEACDAAGMKTFSAESDLISLHYDHAADKDDGQSAAADRTILESIFGPDWIRTHVIAVSGVYGKNSGLFVTDSDAVMDAVWNDRGGWLAGHADRENVVAELTRRWTQTLKAGGDVWVKEGGQSDISAQVVKRIRKQAPDIDTGQRIHLVQHSQWNENQTTDAALALIKTETDYIKIRDANAYLNIEGGDTTFVRSATEHPVFGKMWKAAFAYYNPNERLDFSDTGELMHILGLGEMGINDFRQRFLSDKNSKPSNKPNAGHAK